MTKLWIFDAINVKIQPAERDLISHRKAIQEVNKTNSRKSGVPTSNKDSLRVASYNIEHSIFSIGRQIQEFIIT